MKSIGLYIHIPFCSFCCHYCDFVKTANWDENLVKKFFITLKKHIQHWKCEYLNPHHLKIETVNIGGGTPGLFSHEYEGIFEELESCLLPNTEISIEVNPLNAHHATIKKWQELGINRVSIGIQTFDDQGLSFLKRDHTKNHAIKSIEVTQQYIENINLDLIYAWKDQTLKIWQEDLATALNLQPKHLSLYNLTYAEGTPIGRAHARGKIIELTDSTQYAMYEHARLLLEKKGFIHDEVSNWSQPGFTCRHNWKYWQGDYFIGIGPGAHGFIEDPNSLIGMRYGYQRKIKNFIDSEPSFISHGKFLQEDSQIEIEKRTTESWLLEYLGSSLRCSRGIDLKRIENITGKTFKATPLVAEKMKEKKIHQTKDRIRLNESEFIRESAWALEFIACFNDI